MNEQQRESWYKSMLYGRYYERYLAYILYKHGYAIMRSGASGAGKKRPEPDILVIKNGHVVGIEVKTTSKDESVKERVDKVVKMKEFKIRANCPLLFCVKYPNRPLLCIDYEYLFRELQYGNKRFITVRKEYILEKGRKILDILNEIFTKYNNESIEEP